MKSLGLFVCSLILLLNVFKCSNKIKSLRKINKEDDLYSNNEISSETKITQRKNSLKKSSLEKKIVLKIPINSTENNTHLNNNSEIYKGNCFVKIHNYFYNLHSIDVMHK